MQSCWKKIAVLFNLGPSTADKKSLVTKAWSRICISMIIIVVVILMSLPVIFFFIPTVSVDAMQNGAVNSTAPDCQGAVPYSGTVCREELLFLIDCLSEDSSISSDPLVLIDGSLSAGSLITGLQAFGSPECVTVAVPLLCAFLFGGVCSGTGDDGMHYLPSQSQCVEISTGVCRMEFELASSLNIQLPDCATLPEEEMKISCSNSSDKTDGLSPSSLANCPALCREDFFCDEDTNGCVPQCPDWSVYSPSTNAALSTITLVSAVVGAIAGTALLVIGAIRWKKVLVFPSILIIYETISFLVLIFFLIITFIDQSGLYCSSPNLLESIFNPTNFCVVSGAALHYVLLQVNVWFVLHITLLFWKVYFPFHAQVQSAKGLKLIHFLCVTLALLIPIIPVIAPIAEYATNDKDSSQPVLGKWGYGFFTFPPILCAGLDATVSFYSMILPNDIMLLYSAVAIILVIWKIHKEQGLFHSKSKAPFRVSTAEKKLLIVFCYYTLLLVVGLVFLSLITKSMDVLSTELLNYFVCEQRGHDPSNPCSRGGTVYPEMAIMSFILLLHAPAVNLIVFIIDYQEVKEKIKTLSSRT